MDFIGLTTKTLLELKAIASERGIIPTGHRGHKQIWIQAIQNFLGVEPVQDAIEVQAQEAIKIESVKPEVEPPVLASERMELNSKVSHWLLSTAMSQVRNSVLPSQAFGKGDRVRVVDIDSRFRGSLGRVVSHQLYVAVQFDIPVCATGSPSLARGSIFTPHQLTLVSDEIFPGVSFDVEEFQQTHAAEIDAYVASFTEVDRPPNRGSGDRGRLETELRMSQSAIAQVSENSPGVTFRDSFLARYSPPQSENIHYQPDANGQLNLFDFEVESTVEPPDPDDFESLDVFREAIAIWDASHPDLIEIGFDSFREWAPCPDNWYESAVSIELFEMFELSEPEPSKRCPCGAMPAFQCDGTTATHIYSDCIIFTPCYKNNLDGIQFDFNFCDRVGARASPGGDAVF